MSPENRSYQPTNEKAIKAIDSTRDQSADPHLITLPISDEGHIIEGTLEEIVQHPNALDGLQFASRAFWEAQGFDDISIEKNVTKQSEQARDMLQKLQSLDDLPSMKKRERKEAQQRIERARMNLRAIFQATHENYQRLIENIQPQLIQDAAQAPVTVFSAEEYRTQKKV